MISLVDPICLFGHLEASFIYVPTCGFPVFHCFYMTVEKFTMVVRVNVRYSHVRSRDREREKERERVWTS